MPSIASFIWQIPSGMSMSAGRIRSAATHVDCAAQLCASMRSFCPEIASSCAIAAAVAVYAVMIVLTGAVTQEDMALIPHGEKLGKLMHLRSSQR